MPTEERAPAYTLLFGPRTNISAFNDLIWSIGFLITLINFADKNKNDDLDKGAEDLRLATRHLGMIVGKVDVEEILGSIFNDFCIGK